MKYEGEIKAAFKVSIPIMMGYCVLGFAFGLLLVSFDYSWYIAPLMSIFIYAGALQFVAINFFNIKAGLIDIAIASWFVNLRQSFYGLSLLKKYKKAGRLKAYLIFGLTDETYGILTTIDEDDHLKKEWYYFFLTLFNQSYWLLGSTLGAIVGSAIEFNTAGLEFSLTALFIVLCLEQYKKIKNNIPFLIAILVSVFSLIFIPSDKMLVFSIGLALIFLFSLKSRIEKNHE